MSSTDKLTGDRKGKSSWSRLKKQWKTGALDALGLQVRKKRPAEWRTRDYFQPPLARGIKGIPDERCFVLQNVVRSLKDVRGDVAECGLRFGKSTAFMLSVDRPDRAYCLFDSFEGLSAPSPEDFMEGASKAHWEKSDLGVPEDIVKANLAGFPNELKFYKGWIPTRFPEVAERSFALLHVDVDLYEPTRDALEFFWPRLVPGGVVVCDDYGSRKCPGAKRAFDEYFADGRGRLMELTTVQALVFKPG
ncbi:TylF/MycF/NovP-related O-methyltransferase [Hansschlegelia sp. KR7-227]|uniref:TylF/MycF/NovP-related O-methyltransferase n=1 Tax=Hansschlegelia sp. KR7-227 TaxID=3400914 RepID=UPI003C0B0596